MTKKKPKKKLSQTAASKAAFKIPRLSDIIIGNQRIKPGERKKIDIQIARLYDFTEMNIPVEVVRGTEPGPVLFVCAAIHGDEINGVEIVKRLLNHKALKGIRGSLIAVPIVNVFGFNTKSRYLPDRRDLNRCFPGSEGGSLGSQLAFTFMKEIVSHATHGIDLHTGAIHRSNLPHIRARLNDEETKRLAEAFHVPVIMNSDLRDGSLRESAQEKDIKMLLYEGGEALRFNDGVIKTGVYGVLAVMHAIGMINYTPYKTKAVKSYSANSSHWIRAPYSGILVARKHLGQMVKKNEVIATVTDPFGEHCFPVAAVHSGIVIGMSKIPLVNEGDAVFHIATFENSRAVKHSVAEYQDNMTDIESDTYVR